MPDEISIGTVSLVNAPRVALAIGDGADRGEVTDAMTQGADLLELRIDHFHAVEVDEVLAELGRFRDLPKIGTIRSAEEGGRWSGSDVDRAGLYHHIIPHVQAVDVEVSARAVAPDVVRMAHAEGIPVIGSFHDFERTPTADELEELSEYARALEVDLLKVAAYCGNLGDVQRLAAFTLAEPAPITVGMGERGMLTRVFFPALGSLLTYTFLGTPTAPGQLTCAQTLEYLDAFYPERRL